MYKLIFYLFFLSSFNLANQSDEIVIDISRDHKDNILIQWNVNIENVDRIFLSIEYLGLTQEYELPSLTGQISLCCYPADFKALITVTQTVAIETDNEECQAINCINFISNEYFNQVFSPSSTTTTTTTTTTTSTTTTTTIPPTVQTIKDEDVLSNNQNFDYLNIEFTNALITSIPVFNEIDFTDQEKNSLGVVISTAIVILFYIVLLLQEWFGKILTEYDTKIFNRNKQTLMQSKISRFIKIFLSLIITSLIIAYVEEGASFNLDIENIAIFVSCLVGILIVTSSYEGVEAFTEKYFYDQ